MEFRHYKDNIVQTANSMIENLLMQSEEREQFYNRLLEEKEVHYQRLVQIKEKQIIDIVEQKEQLEEENRKLKEEVLMMKQSTQTAVVNNIQQVNSLMKIEEEDYQQLMEDIQKAYVMESGRLVEHCLNDLIKHSRAYQVYMTMVDFWSSVFIAYIYGRDEDVIKVYGQLDKKPQDQCPERVLYKKLLKLKDINTTLEDYEEVRRDIRDNSRLGMHLYAYIKNELLREIEDVIQQMQRDFIIEQEEVLPYVEAWDEEEQNERDQLIEKLIDSVPSKEVVKNPSSNIEKNIYSMEQIKKAIKTYVEQENWEKLKDAIKYVIRNYKYYQPLFEYDKLYDFLLISYVFEYDEAFIKRFVTDEQLLMENMKGYNLYSMLRAEKNMPLYTLQLDCAARKIRQEIENKEVFKIINGKRLLDKIKQNLIPYTKKILVNGEMGDLINEPDNIWYRSKVFVRSKRKTIVRMVLIEAWKKDSSSKIFISPEELSILHKKIEPYRLSTKQNTDTEKSQPKLGAQKESKTIEIYISNTSIEITKSSKQFDGKEISLNDQSVLKTMGYSTTKSPEERWRILSQIAVPQLGKQKVVGYLKFFIKLHKTKKNMVSAIQRWEYDLRRLEDL